MASIVPIVSIALALIAAGCIAYIAWELTAEDKPRGKPDDNGPPESN
ncbi:MAG: hypothetical protein OEM78_16920 [Gammaproteobacteria bacterium]|nr:hypothetical protein [Gammaproteobacteria bacterium]